MLDLVFLGLGIYIFVKASKGEYKETACNVALVVGILAAIVGAVCAIVTHNDTLVFMNIIVMIIAFGIRFAAKHLVKLYLDKLAEETAQLEHEEYLRSGYRNPSEKKPVYTDENFDDEELRFGKGGYTDNKL
ncbi:MAG: hypothetical protein MR364_01960 [Oscillospiraceae bacterium]|nr:hypothetical protein [Oscillospiraceae bacterium]